MDDEHSITQLTTEETLKFLSEISFGRLALSIKGHPDIFPINFAIHTRSSDHVVAYIRTSPGTKLYATAVGSPLALEADRIEGNIATSAVLYGTGRMRSEERRVGKEGRHWSARLPCDEHTERAGLSKLGR